MVSKWYRSHLLALSAQLKVEAKEAARAGLYGLQDKLQECAEMAGSWGHQVSPEQGSLLDEEEDPPPPF